MLNHARTFRDGRQAKGVVRSQNLLKKAAAGVIEPLEGRALLSGEQLGTDVFTDFNHQADQWGVIAKVGNDKLIQVGMTTSASAIPEFLLAQFKADGTRDNDFGTNGVSTQALPSPLSAEHRIVNINAVAVDSLGRIVVVGTANHSTFGADYLVARFNPDGTLDTATDETPGHFGGVGVVITDKPGGGDNQGRAVALHSGLLHGDKIVVGGSYASGDHHIELFGVVRYNVDGTIDTSFNALREITANAFTETSQDQLRALTIDPADPNQKIVLAGTTIDGGGPAFGLQRYNSDGSVDVTFGDGGDVKTVIDPTVQTDIAYAVTIDSQGGIIAGGTSAFSSETELRIDLAIARYSDDGILDIGFGNGGVITTSLGNGMVGTIDSLALQPDGKILVGGSKIDETSLSPYSLLVARYETDGSLDADFGIVLGHSFVGHAPETNRTSIVVLTDQALSPDEVVLGNYVPGPDGNGDFVLSRFALGGNAAPTVDPITGPASGARNFAQTFSSSFNDADAGDSHTVTWDFGDGSDDQVTSEGPGSISASHVYATTGTYTVTVTVDDGNDSVSQIFEINVASSAVVNGQLQVGGSDDANEIAIRPGANPANTRVEVDGVLAVHSGVNSILVLGGDGADLIRISADTPQRAIVLAGGGDDSVRGGAAADILVGGDGADLLTGRDGRDLLIGGDGEDRIVGDAHDDILVAGFTSHDADVDALLAIRAEWTSGRGYGQRSANILNQTVVINGNTFNPGTRNNGNTFLKPADPGATVFDDADRDVLTGDDGRDLFLFNNDGAAAESVRDRIVDLASNELAADIDFLNEP